MTSIISVSPCWEGCPRSPVLTGNPGTNEHVPGANPLPVPPAWITPSIFTAGPRSQRRKPRHGLGKKTGRSHPAGHGLAFPHGERNRAKDLKDWRPRGDASSSAREGFPLLALL